jgi:hypothetical protein
VIIGRPADARGKMLLSDLPITVATIVGVVQQTKLRTPFAGGSFAVLTNTDFAVALVTTPVDRSS